LSSNEATREVTLRYPDGSRVTFVAGDEVVASHIRSFHVVYEAPTMQLQVLRPDQSGWA
jgi:hypothetical protein